jgi:hypothetical protein
MQQRFFLGFTRFITSINGGLIVALIFALVTRLPFVCTRTLPIGDGGLWYQASRQILTENFALPFEIQFNHQSFALVYPPLAAFTIAFCSQVLGQSLLSVLLWLPFFLNLAALIAFQLFVRAYFKHQSVAALATLLFPITFQSLGVFLLGGGVPRGMGLCFQLLSWWTVCAATERKGFRPLLTAIFMALAILSHPNAALWTVSGVCFLGILERRLPPRILFTIVVLVLLLISPWLVTVLCWHGSAPFLRAFETGSAEMFNWRLLGTPERL